MSNKTRWVAVGGAAVAGVALMSSQQTGALWSQTETLSPGSISSGTLDLAVGGAGVTDYPFEALAKEGLGGGQYAQAPIPIINSGDVVMKYRLQDAMQSNAAVPLDLTVFVVDSPEACPAEGDPVAATVVYDGPLIGAQAPAAPQWRMVEPGASEVLCMRGTVGEDAQPNESTTASFVFGAES
ncbi:hypothetical protein BFN03_09770 [Rhodococcus sp. WMMA185]|uniref:hypothetical protein n=1 Tax=Rhodococcus sp. WMMA185 TaxID=679318 RepID=UPI000878BCC1|nr:hypothetical protein [Rhodococcus sp. WMMA185]AOW92858.1 hypothetical protein BFN03_09705 [Rhodococcus sp. WMMA185]AOW92862.1 hypothetical protein BFN03_09725 [Rhodococcus sp. WMMA185]AOW92866.1 hypothetical protein BFN03_09745 [Rhodococcus sp. WMMA185]AOW92871.1 hypothetical protein BFN03_09770 [Rhodococcus sp. WMMA185]